MTIVEPTRDTRDTTRDTDLSDDDERMLAREAWHASGGTLTGRELADRFGRPAKWGQRRRLEAVAEAGGHRNLSAVTTLPTATEKPRTPAPVTSQPKPRTPARRRQAGPLPWLALLLGLGASLAANVAAAEPTVQGRLVAAWPPVALALSVEMLLRQTRGDAPTSTSVRWVTAAAVTLVALVAAAASYSHMHALALEAGEGSMAVVLPLSVDGLVVAATMTLLSARRTGRH